MPGMPGMPGIYSGKGNRKILVFLQVPLFAAVSLLVRVIYFIPFLAAGIKMII
jgi:hypothetical protein